jgi:threonine/homoserine/homoserine lactone efflux protein
LFFAGFFTGAVLWCIGIAGIIRWGRRWVRPSLFRWINALCGLALGYFGARVLWIALQDWLEHQVVPTLKPTR